MTAARKTASIALFAAGSAAGILALCACGRVGLLERPAPLVGARAKAEYQKHKADAEAAAQDAKDDAAPEPLPPESPGPYQPGGYQGTIRENPPPGMPQAAPPAPPGVLPDPYRNPQ